MHAAAQSGKNSIAYCLRQLVRDKAELPTLLEDYRQCNPNIFSADMMSIR